ncbi:putative disease resistance protein RGA4 [Oryza brachyantha]|uniref:Uncharacterized protein n=1 Tax=Oryza brachyantha TaxID=4533 RepID=J3N755_ORYBR|nr:putative disease resistance protein RGA4 [Oryza brachyantha]
MATILDSFVGFCIKKVHDIVMEEAISILGVDEELEELHRRMKQIQCFLHDAEQRKIEEQAINNWLGELKDAIYDADDIIDMAKFEGSKLLANQPLPSRLQIKSIFCCDHSVLSCIHNVQTRRKIALRIRRVNHKLQKISIDRTFLTLENVKATYRVVAASKRHTSHLVEPNLVGKEIKYATSRLVELVLAHKEDKAYKLAIVGTGGVGKTTLAQSMYNDRRVKGNFSKQAWLCVSQDYSEVNLLKELLRNIGVHERQGETVGELQSKLASAVKDESFFIVLDDVWQSEVWLNVVRTPFHSAAKTTILVTTRDELVAGKIGADHLHRVDMMSTDVGWELLWKSMNIKEEKEVETLKSMGIKIVKKCGGLPLAIKVIASVLATKEKIENAWEKVLGSSAWSMSKLPAELRGALYLSYDDLPHNLKQCFLYCALYVEGLMMHRADLVRFWVAEGFVEEQEGELLEDTAEEYYHELIYRNLLEPDPFYFDHYRCKMHDLLRCLAQHLSREECYFDQLPLETTTWSKLRRISVVNKTDIVSSMVEGHYKVRTLHFCMSPKIDSVVYMRFPHLRVLDLTGSLVQRIPDSISSLIHLRLLDLDATDISCLPESIGSLINLQILNLQRCYALHSLPMAIIKLCNLRRLGLDDTPINQVPTGISRLSLLNDLQGFPVGHSFVSARMQDGWNLEELGHLLKMKRLDMIKLENAIPCGTSSLLLDMKHLKFLNLRCTTHTKESYTEEDINNVENVFEELNPPCNLEDLSIAGSFGQRYPTWIGANLSSLKILRLIDCTSWAHLPAVGQLPNLKCLKIMGASSVAKIGPELLYDKTANPWFLEAIAFPRLEWLVISNMPNWEEWSFTEEIEASDGMSCTENNRMPLQVMPLLQKLELGDCPKLRALPLQLEQATSLKCLHIEGAHVLKVVEDLTSLSDSLLLNKCEGLESLSNLPQVRTLYVSDCPALRQTEKLEHLQQLWLSKDLQMESPLWLSLLKQRH